MSKDDRQDCNEKIRQTLSHISDIPLGNPHAREQLQKINTRKKAHAIMFAMLLQPIIDIYRNQDLSQRAMVELLNDQNICAYAGGTWVLSQLQKVITRINNIKAIYVLYTQNPKWLELSDTDINQILKNEHDYSIDCLRETALHMLHALELNDAIIDDDYSNIAEDDPLNIPQHIEELKHLQEQFLAHPKFGQHLTPSSSQVLSPILTTLIAQIQALTKA